MHTALLAVGMLLVGIGLFSAARATSDPFRTQRLLLAFSAGLIVLGVLAVLFGVTGLLTPPPDDGPRLRHGAPTGIPAVVLAKRGI